MQVNSILNFPDLRLGILGYYTDFQYLYKLFVNYMLQVSLFHVEQTSKVHLGKFKFLRVQKIVNFLRKLDQ